MKQSLCLRYACILSAVILLFILTGTAAASDDSLTRGGQFTVTVIGLPNTPYYIWLSGTSSMTGEPGDQPPIILANQANIVEDPAGGPYTIGNYQYNNGGGRTIRDDVCPSTPTVSNTNYYAQVTTGSDGFGTVAFATSSATAERTFSVKAQNPASPGSTVNVVLGVPTPVPTTVLKTPVVTIPPVPKTPTPTAPLTEITLPPPTTVPVTTVPTATQKTPIGGVSGIAALAGAVLFMARKTG